MDAALPGSEDLDLGRCRVLDELVQTLVGQNVVRHRLDHTRRGSRHIRTDFGAFAHVVGSADRRGKDIGLKTVIVVNLTDIREIYDNYGFETQILAASIRTANHMSECAKIGADVATAPPNVIKAMASHVLTDKGLDAFLKDWEKTGQKIL